MKAIGDKAYSRREQLLRQYLQVSRETNRMMRQKIKRQERYIGLLQEMIMATKGTPMEDLSPRKLSALQKRKEIGRELHRRRMEKVHQTLQKGPHT
jgi:hypothetical protein